MINYPNGVKKNKKVQHPKTFDGNKNRGMVFEDEINTSNEIYRTKNVAIIYKKPTPIKVVKITNTGLKQGKITEAYYERPSTTDYNGIYRQKYIDFEAKETLNKTSFPMHNIHAHQIEHLSKIKAMGGISFLIVSFRAFNEVYILDAGVVEKYNHTTRRSIPYEVIKKEGILVPQGYVIRIDYLKAVDELYFKEK